MYTAICSIKYYLLPVKEQMYVKQMILMAQRPNELTAGVTPMNMDYFVNVSFQIDFYDDDLKNVS